jgi:5-oxoprolinase (ATP-hydrolysing)
MNNFVFGAEDGSGKQYYETIAGGSGACKGHNGASGVQIHMTNTRATDPEVLEHRFPEIRLEHFGLRQNSGGDGLYKGGNGTIRKVKFLKKRKVSILSERRNFPPYGMAGGLPGKCGKNELIKTSGKLEPLAGKVERIVKSGETIIIETPGGGGYGSPLKKDKLGE